MAPLASPVLALGLALATHVEVPLGGRALPMEVELEVRTSSGGGTAALAWNRHADGTLEGRVSGTAYEAAVRIGPAVGGARDVAISIRWTAPAGLERAALRLAWPGAPRAIRRDLAFAPVVAPIRTGRGTPVLVAAGDAILAGGPGLVAARVERAASATRATLFLDDADERPFSTYDACLERLPGAHAGQAISWTTLEVRHPVRHVARAPGDEDFARATLYATSDGASFRPVVVERWPAGTRAAVVFTDHADRTDIAALRAALWGSSDPRAEGGIGAGFLGRGLRLTRTFFAHARQGSLDDPDARLIADDLAASGSEVALHSITPDRDDRDSVRAGLSDFAHWRPTTWIDHEPYTNCEAVSSRGAGVEAPFGVRDLLEAASVRWVWAAGDVDGRAGVKVVNLLGGDPSEPRPAVFPLPADPRLWVFRSSMFHAAPAELAAALSDGALSSLERERGLFVAHTYLGPSPRTTRSRDQALRIVVADAGGGALEIAPVLDAALARVAARVRAGTLASLPWTEAGDRLRALGDVEVRYLPDGSAEVHNHGDAPIEALTVAMPAAGLDVVVEDAALLGREDDGDWTRLWFDIGPGERVVLRAFDGLLPVPLLPSR